MLISIYYWLILYYISIITIVQSYTGKYQEFVAICINANSNKRVIFSWYSLVLWWWMILSFKPQISLRILPPINVANTRYHSCLVAMILVLDSTCSSRMHFPVTSKTYGGLTELAAVRSIQPRTTLWMMNSNSTFGRRSFGGDSPLLCHLTTPILYNLVPVSPGEYNKRSFTSVAIT